MKLTSDLIINLSHCYQEILNVVKIVKDIALKTSLLALNSAIEVARAQKSLANPCKLKI